MPDREDDPPWQRDDLEKQPIASLPPWQSVHMLCLACRRFAAFTTPPLKELVPKGTTLRDLRIRGRCKRCNARKAHWILIDRTRRGRRMWIPAHPDEFKTM